MPHVLLHRCSRATVPEQRRDFRESEAGNKRMATYETCRRTPNRGLRLTHERQSWRADLVFREHVQLEFHFRSVPVWVVWRCRRTESAGADHFARTSPTPAT